MKKLWLLIAILLTGVALVNASPRKGGVPQNPDGSYADSSDYLGVDYSTAAFTSNAVLAFDGEGVVVGMIASSATAVSDFVIFRDTYSILGSDTVSTDEAFRVSISSAGGVPVGSGFMYKFPAPVRFRKGCAWRASVATINSIAVLYHRFD